MIYLLYIVIHYNDTLAKKSRYTHCFIEAVLHDVYSKLSHQNIVTCFGILIPVPQASCMLLKKFLNHYLILGFLCNDHVNWWVLFILLSTCAHNHLQCAFMGIRNMSWAWNYLCEEEPTRRVNKAADAVVILCNWMKHFWMRDDSGICCLFFELISTRFVMVL